MSEGAVQIVALSEACRGASAFRSMLVGTSAPPAPIVPPGDDYARGVADGQDLAATAFAVERQQLAALVTAAQALQPEPSEELAQLIAEAVVRLVTQIVADAPIDAAWLKAQAARAAEVVADCDAARTLWLHPDDIALLGGTQMPLPVQADQTAARGSIRIECSAGWIEHGRSIYLDALRSALALEDTV